MTGKWELKSTHKLTPNDLKEIAKLLLKGMVKGEYKIYERGIK